MHREAGRGRKRSPRVLLLINMSFLWDSGRRGYKNDVEGRSKKREESERERERDGDGDGGEIERE